MKFVAAGLTDVGKQRAHNEDTIMVGTDLGLFIVADGMGGHRAGEVASALACESVTESMRAPTDAPTRTKALEEAIRNANTRVVREGMQNRARKGMGTTIVSLVIDGDVAGISHAGDSRCYLFRKGQLHRMTKDHSLVEELGGDDPAVQMALAGFSNVITRALGTAIDTLPETRREPLQKGDLFLLCSDGLSGVVEENVIRRILTHETNLDEACKALIEAANDQDAPDNVSAVLVRIEG